MPFSTNERAVNAYSEQTLNTKSVYCYIPFMSVSISSISVLQRPKKKKEQECELLVFFSCTVCTKLKSLPFPFFLIFFFFN